MKTKILTITMIALMMGMTINGSAGPEDTLKMIEPTSEFQASINLFPDNIVQFQIVKPLSEKVKLRVYDESGILIYTYSIRKHKTARIGFDTKLLKPGNYDYVIERNKEEVLRKTFTRKDANH